MDLGQLLVYGALVAGFLLLNSVLRRAARRAQEQQEREAARQREATAPPDDEAPDEFAWGRQPVAEPLPAAAAPAEPAEGPVAPRPPPARAPRHAAAGAFFRSPGDLRRAIVTMTVLGPCRALDPYDPRKGGPA